MTGIVVVDDLGIELGNLLECVYGWSFEDKINTDGKYISGVKPEVMDNYFLHYKFNTASELLSAIDIQESELRSKNYNEKHTFIYRGHREHDWKLIPSFFRDSKNIDMYLGRFESGDGPELQMFLHFLKSVNNQGIYIGNSDRELRAVNYFEFGRKYGFFTGRNIFHDFPTEDQLPVLALAQHYGVPTRLLDFSRNPYKALFFASSSLYPFSNPDTKSNKRIGLWVFSELQIYVASLCSYVRRVDVPKFQNQNLIAQEGLFVHYIPPRSAESFPYAETKFFNEAVPRDGIKPLHEVVVDVMRDKKWLSIKNMSKNAADNLAKILNDVTGLPMLFSLPHTESFEINRKLDQLNINSATMMPNLEGAAHEALRRVRGL